MKYKGFTLVEVLMAVALFSVLTAVVYLMFFAGSDTFNIGVDQSLVQKQARTAADFITKELRTAETISSETLSGEYYILQLKDKDGESYLVKTTCGSDGLESDAFIVPLSGMSFSPSDSSSMIGIYVEAGRVKAYEINLEARLENISAVSIPPDSAVIYYSKY